MIIIMRLILNEYVGTTTSTATTSTATTSTSLVLGIKIHSDKL